MERKHLFHVSNSCFSLKKIKNLNKRKECDQCQQAGGEEFAAGSQPLFSERPFLLKKPKPSSSGTGSIVVASRDPGRVLRELNLFDENQVLENSADSDSSNKESAGELERRVAFNLRTMRSSYTLEDMMEERSRGVSTEISLYHHDPFKIKKKMKPSDLGNLCRLLVSADLVEKHILPFLNEDQTKQVEIPNHKRNGLKVWVRDIDTASMHQMVFKRWSSSKSYIFNDGWTKQFVRRRSLVEGDEIGLYWDSDQSMLHFSVLCSAAAAGQD
ncbi:TRANSCRIPTION FACTOR B3-DOMAIN FAMILY-RELATED [Salix purpurea]|uniref:TRANSCRIPTION FACTOR B3-DOMAIN FAMILY-RELATED n=1 Tax=Salix purpurea TaxID=77065 RepID=A0A9Q0QGX6_SALPP|nr:TRANSCRIPTION FACTOR B3-DOMAIN FAMILY-RELATED [Salix purpurea]